MEWRVFWRRPQRYSSTKRQVIESGHKARQGCRRGIEIDQARPPGWCTLHSNKLHTRDSAPDFLRVNLLKPILPYLTVSYFLVEPHPRTATYSVTSGSGGICDTPAARSPCLLLQC